MRSKKNSTAMTNYQEIADKLNEMAEKQNKKVSWDQCDKVLRVTSGKKRRRYSLYIYPVLTNKKTGERFVHSRLKQHWGIVGADRLINTCRGILKKNVRFELQVGWLSQQNESEEVPEQCRINFGKYKGLDIEWVKENDTEYFDWLCKEMWKIKPMYQGELYFYMKKRKYLKPSYQDTIPYGKYKGHRLEEIAKVDEQYAFWLIDKVVNYLQNNEPSNTFEWFVKEHIVDT